MAKVGTLVLDAGPLITLTREELFSKADNLVTTPAVVREIKDEAARQRLEVWKEQLKVQQPSKESVKFVHDFAKKTGDALVLSTQDIEIIALAYELYPDKSQLRQAPRLSQANAAAKPVADAKQTEQEQEELPKIEKLSVNEMEEDGFEVVKPKRRARKQQRFVQKHQEPEPEPEPVPEEVQEESQAQENEDDSDSDWSDDGWITGENLEEKLNNDSNDTAPISAPVDIALASRDFAVQNVALQIGLGAVNERGLAIKQLRNYMQRCHACFHLMPLPADGRRREFCPRCGGHTVTRVTVSVKDDGTLRVHLKANMQWKTRGDKYTLANPQSIKARRSQRPSENVELYAEDQPEFMKAKKLQSRLERRNEKIAEQYIGPSTVDSAVSPFMGKREMTTAVRIGRGRHANAKHHK